jgi:hypothetical protein
LTLSLLRTVTNIFGTVPISFSDRVLQIKMFSGIFVICNKFDAVLLEWLPVIKPVRTKGGSDWPFARSYSNALRLLEINFFVGIVVEPYR